MSSISRAVIVLLPPSRTRGAPRSSSRSRPTMTAVSAVASVRPCRMRTLSIITTRSGSRWKRIRRAVPVSVPSPRSREVSTGSRSTTAVPSRRRKRACSPVTTVWAAGSTILTRPVASPVSSRRSRTMVSAQTVYSGETSRASPIRRSSWPPRRDSPRCAVPIALASSTRTSPAKSAASSRRRTVAVRLVRTPPGCVTSTLPPASYTSRLR